MKLFPKLKKGMNQTRNKRKKQKQKKLFPKLNKGMNQRID